MLGRTEYLFKWTLYAAGVVICWLVHGLLLQHWVLFGAMPFIFPMLAALIAMYEGPFSGSICGIVLGVACDLVIAAPIPCFYTLVFPVAAMLSGLIARNWLRTSLLCAAAVTLLAFLLTDSFHCLLLLFTGRGMPAAAFGLAARETCATFPLLIPAYFFFRRIYDICHVYD